jgi:hypothetical protein
MEQIEHMDIFHDLGSSGSKRIGSCFLQSEAHVWMWIIKTFVNTSWEMLAILVLPDECMLVIPYHHVRPLLKKSLHGFGML